MSRNPLYCCVHDKPRTFDCLEEVERGIYRCIKAEKCMVGTSDRYDRRCLITLSVLLQYWGCYTLCTWASSYVFQPFCYWLDMVHFFLALLDNQKLSIKSGTPNKAKHPLWPKPHYSRRPSPNEHCISLLIAGSPGWHLGSHLCRSGRKALPSQTHSQLPTPSPPTMPCACSLAEGPFPLRRYPISHPPTSSHPPPPPSPIP